jgi:hypothetical protein
MAGERGVLTADAPVFYGLSSGTTGGRKVVPISQTYRAEFQRTVQISFAHLYRRFPAAFTGRFLYFVGARRSEIAPDGLDVGAISGFNFTEQPALIRALYAWPYELFQVEDLEARGYMALHQAILGDISLITGVFPLPIVMMLRDLERHSEALAHDLERGTLDGAPGLSPEARAFFKRRLTPRPDLARRVVAASRLPIEEKAAAVWPKLRLAYCWNTATAGLYVPELKRRLGPGVAVRDAIFAATEAWCNVPLGDEEPGGPLAVSSVYFEFIEEQAYEAGGRDTCTLADLEDGRRYVIVTSNATGYYRYILGDVIEVCGRYHATPRVRFVRKAGAASNLVGELLDETHVNQAVSEALAIAGLEATWFSLVANPAGEVPGYDLHLELTPAQAEMPLDALSSFGAQVDDRLAAAAHKYALRRSAMQLRALTVRPVPQGTYDTWRRARLAAGSGEAQLKTTHLVGDPANLPVEFRL